MENFTICLKWIAFSINFCVCVVNVRRIVEAWIVRRGELQLEKTRLQLKANLISEREARWNLANAERLIRSGGDAL